MTDMTDEKIIADYDPANLVPQWTDPSSGQGGVYGKTDMGIFRVMMLISGLHMEITTGMQLTRGPKCSTLVRREYGFKGKPPKLLMQLVDHHIERAEIRSKGDEPV